MNAFPDSRQEFGEEDHPVGPAMPRPDALPDAGDDALLPPFARGGAPPPAGAGDGTAAPFDFPAESFDAFDETPADTAGIPADTDGDLESEEELPWLVTAEESGQEGAMPAWLDLGAAAEADPDRESDSAPEAERGFEAGSAPAADPGFEAHFASEADSAPASAEDGAEGAPALAERFESIARMLRARGVAGVLEEGARDPLGLLLTGFALGYLQRDGEPRG